MDGSSAVRVSGFPTGMVTFLFTDIEGSTRLWESDAAAMSVALAAHDTILRAAIEENGGVVFKTVGDAFCAAFTRPEDALAAALDAQRRVAAHLWGEPIGTLRVRMGMHTGAAVASDGDYFGPTVNRVARVTSIGHGEQILVSSATAALLRDVLPDGIALSDIGTHRLKDLATPEPTYQVLAPGLRSAFPALTSLESRPNNIPFEISSFIGREAELAAVDQALRERRLVSIVGPGGIGKSRLALQAAAQAIGRFAGGAWVVALSPLHSEDLIANAVADVLHVRETPQERIEDSIMRELADREVLLVLDSAEHLLARTAIFANTLLRRCASVKVLVTSREPLHLTGELVYRVGPLEKAAELLLDRAREVLGDFVPDDAAVQAVEEICGRLECIPLAIELAAARLATIPLTELNARLARSLSVLVSRDSTKEQRHRTLRATIAWSYDLLDPHEAELMRALAVFRGAFDVAAVTSVAQRSEDENLETIEALADKSLVSLSGGTATARYVLPDTVRDFAVELLRADGSLDALAGRHFDHYASAVSSKSLQSGGADIGTRFDDIGLDASNIRTALDWGVKHRPVAAAQMAIGLSLFWKIRGHLAEGRGWFRRLLESEAVEGTVRAAIMRRAAAFATLQDEHDEARALSLASLALYEAASDAGGIGEALHNLAVIEQRSGDSNAAAAHYAGALERFREAGHDYGQFVALYNMALLAFERDDLSAAEQCVDEATRVAVRTGDPDQRATATSAAADLALRRDDLEEAGRLYRDALALKRSLGNAHDVADIQNSLSIIYMRQGRVPEAVRAARETMRLGLELNAGALVIHAFEAFCDVAVQEREFERAACYFGLARKLRRIHAYEPTARKMHAVEGIIRSELRDRFEAAAAAGGADDWRAIATGLAAGP